MKLNQGRRAIVGVVGGAKLCVRQQLLQRPAMSQHQPPSAAWTEPPWSGWIETTGDALLILEAARRGLIPRVTRRLVDSERKMITSGSVFVFDEDESHIKRWTDGFFWSPSRILGNFLLYRETEKRGAGHRSSTRIEEQDPNPYDPAPAHSLSRPKSDAAGLAVDRHRERTLMGSLTNSYKFKPDGLMKKTFSVTIGGVAQHLISYYKIEDVENGRLRSPSSLPELAALDISPEYLDKTHFRNPPKVEIGADGVPRYRGEADDLDGSPSMLSAPLAGNMPLLTDPAAPLASSSIQKRQKRSAGYEEPPTGSKRARRNTGGSSQFDSGSNGTTPTADPGSPHERGASSTPQPAGSSTTATPTTGSAAAPPAEQPSHTLMTPAPLPTYAQPYGMPYYSYPHAHGGAPPPPPMYATQGMGVYGAPPPAGSPAPAVHYAPYGSYAHAMPHPPLQLQTQVQQHASQQQIALQPTQQQQIQQQQQQQQQQLSAPSPAHRTDPSQTATAGIPPGPPASVPAPTGPVLYAGLPQLQAPPPQQYYGYYHPHAAAPPGLAIPPMGVSMNPMVAPMGISMGTVPYPSYLYSGYPPPQAHHPPAVPQHKREDGSPSAAT